MQKCNEQKGETKLKKLFKQHLRQFKSAAEQQQGLATLTDAELIHKIRQENNQAAVAHLFIRHDGIIASNYSQFASSFNQEDFEGEAMKFFTIALNEFDCAGKAKFSSYLHVVLNNGLLNVVTQNKAQKRSLYECDNFTDLQTIDEEGNVKEFEIPIEQDFSEANVKHFIADIDLTEHEKQFIEYFMKFGKGSKKDKAGEGLTEFASKIGISRTQAYNVRDSLKIKLKGLNV